MTSPTFVRSGSEGDFTIYNYASNNIAVGCYTNDGNSWSSNYLSGDLGLEQEAYALCDADIGSCEELF